MIAVVSEVLVLVLSASALGDDALFPDEVGNGLEQLQAAVARLGGGDLRNVEPPRDLTDHQVVKRDGRGVGDPCPHSLLGDNALLPHDVGHGLR